MTSADIQDYIPEDQWPPVSTMLEGFGDQTLPASPALAGTSLSLLDEDGSKAEYIFDNESSLTWTLSRDGDKTGGTADYKAIEARPGIFIIDFIRGEGSATENVTIIADRNTGATTTGVSRFVTVDGRTRSTTDFSQANTEGSSVRHQRSTALVGKRIYYRYSDVETYEHIYLNPGTFTWNCIRGGEAGLADTDRCMTWEVAEDLFIFFWTEKVMCVEAVLLVDLREQRSIGRMFGWDDPAAEPVVLPFNSRLSVLNTTEYPQDFHKH
ncbi:MoaF C-terminal domain-containing protein [Arthrobacter sp. B6]|uniref:MoaF C-terminal domain-containing protein n=1 Tax=Arthrobacter sp. B6 TaxID=1570137 RepID=UPI00082B58A7|nr:MoaF C-terminal domain-containing protein [Arthrobacter sp. B6]